LSFTEHISILPNSRWKLLQTFEAHGQPLESGKGKVDPVALIGTEVGARVDFPKAYYDAKKKNHGQEPPGKWYREIGWVFELPPEEAPEDVFGSDEDDEPVTELDSRVEAEEPETF
jgi:hypothetical protein